MSLTWLVCMMLEYGVLICMLGGIFNEHYMLFFFFNSSFPVTPSPIYHYLYLYLYLSIYLILSISLFIQPSLHLLSTFFHFLPSITYLPLHLCHLGSCVVSEQAEPDGCWRGTQRPYTVWRGTRTVLYCELYCIVLYSHFDSSYLSSYPIPSYPILHYTTLT